MENQNVDPARDSNMPSQHSQKTSSHLSKGGKTYPLRFKKLMNHALDDVAFYQNILETILSEFGDFRSRLETMIEDRDIQGIRQFHHKLNTTLKLLECADLDSFLVDLKADIQNEEFGNNVLGQQVISEFQKMLDEVKVELQNLKATDG